MRPTLYYIDKSAPARSVLLTAKAIGLELDLKTVVIAAGEHLTPEYLKINPQHTVPTLDDNGYYLWDSHAINIYLVTKYAKNDSLYPKDLQKKGTVDQRLFFNASIMQRGMAAIVRPIIYHGANSIPQEKCDDVCKAYNFLEKFLEGYDFIAGDSLTIADFSIVSIVSSLAPFVTVRPNEYPRLSSWFERMQELPYYVEANKVGCDNLVNFIKSKLA